MMHFCTFNSSVIAFCGKAFRQNKNRRDEQMTDIKQVRFSLTLLYCISTNRRRNKWKERPETDINIFFCLIKEEAFPRAEKKTITTFWALTRSNRERQAVRKCWVFFVIASININWIFYSWSSCRKWQIRAFFN